ncbi:MAG TPA: C4-dicarboxylate ABC transporter substrate-binding protein, partial [Candidatus Methylomirabilis sp.]|nr:C4-dicarboxylate ABC transporter substrate-binding protein [Candidatus Methylomirabilis sp.]
QRKWIQQAADYALPLASRKALELSASAVGALQRLGVKFQDRVDKQSFIVLAAPLQDSQAQELGKYAVQLLGLVRGIK